MSAREAILKGLSEAGLYNVQDDDADFVIMKLIDAGYRLLAPGELDDATIERCAEVAGKGIYSTRKEMLTGLEVATAIRNLGSNGNG